MKRFALPGILAQNLDPVFRARGAAQPATGV